MSKENNQPPEHSNENSIEHKSMQGAINLAQIGLIGIFYQNISKNSAAKKVLEQLSDEKTSEKRREKFLLKLKTFLEKQKEKTKKEFVKQQSNALNEQIKIIEKAKDNFEEAYTQTKEGVANIIKNTKNEKIKEQFEEQYKDFSKESFKAELDANIKALQDLQTQLKDPKFVEALFTAVSGQFIDNFKNTEEI